MDDSKKARFKSMTVTPCEASVTPEPLWYTGDDVPFKHTKKYLRKWRKRNVKQNYKMGIITKEQKKQMLKELH